jgi:hypothetical protein
VDHSTTHLNTAIGPRLQALKAHINSPVDKAHAFVRLPSRQCSILSRCAGISDAQHVGGCQHSSPVLPRNMQAQKGVALSAIE